MNVLAIDFKLLLVLLVLGVLVGLCFRATRKPALVVLGLLVAMLLSFRVSSVHVERESANIVEPTLHAEPMDVEQASAPAVQPSVRQAAESLVVRAAPGRTSGEADYQENEFRRRPAEHASHVRAHRAPIASVIGTLALILLLYLGLNAWTRGYFQTRLRFLAGALFLLAIVLVMLLA